MIRKKQSASRPRSSTRSKKKSESDAYIERLIKQFQKSITTTKQKGQQITHRGRGKSQIRDGVKYDSGTEVIMYDALTNVGIPFEFQHRIDFNTTVYKDTELPLLKDGGATGIHMIVDFVIEKEGVTYYIDTKGSIEYATATSRLKYNFLKHKLFQDGRASSSAIVWIDYKQTKELLKLSKMKPSSTFWTYFHDIKQF